MPIKTISLQRNNMTREEAKKHARSVCIEDIKIDILLDDIYDHFESRTCINCKFYHKGEYPDDCYCDEGISTAEEFQILEEDFGCILWEGKDD
jgi:hypothetical protein